MIGRDILKATLVGRDHLKSLTVCIEQIFINLFIIYRSLKYVPLSRLVGCHLGKLRNCHQSSPFSLMDDLESLKMWKQVSEPLKCHRIPYKAVWESEHYVNWREKIYHNHSLLSLFKFSSSQPMQHTPKHSLSRFGNDRVHQTRECFSFQQFLQIFIFMRPCLVCCMTLSAPGQSKSKKTSKKLAKL